MYVIYEGNMPDSYFERLVEFLRTRCLEYIQKYRQQILLKENSEEIKEIIVAGFSNIECAKFSRYHIIRINPTVNFNGTNLLQQCREIEYGSLSSKAIPIFEDLFDYVKRNKTELEELFS